MTEDADRAAALSALRAWLSALNGYGDPARTGLAVAQTAVVERGGFGAERGQVVQTLRGADAVNRWLAMTRQVVTFYANEATLCRDASGWAVRYQLTAPDDFVGGGLWQFSVDARGKIVHLRHWPDDLPAGT